MMAQTNQLLFIIIPVDDSFVCGRFISIAKEDNLA